MSYPFLADWQSAYSFLLGPAPGASTSAALGYRAVEAAFGAADGAMAPVRVLFRAIARHLRRRRAVAHLMALDDRLLRDIGIARGDIPAAVRAAHETRRTDGAGPSDAAAHPVEQARQPESELRLAA